ncbi:MAG: shikimate kinase [Bacillales bacterium]|jgi:shikimate kinase|nr:shikimate kinase [Bacillales bacterium]
MKPIILTGFMGCGKTTVGKRLAELLNLEFIDTDTLIIKSGSKSIADIFEEMGEETFRNIESATLKKLINETAVVSSGGGILLKEENRRLIKEAFISIYLECNFDIIVNRLENDNSRPLFDKNNLEEFKNRYLNRLQYYNDCDIKISVDGKSVETICNEIISSLKTSHIG